MLPGGINMTHSKVLHDLCHVLMVEERLPAGLVWKNSPKEKAFTQKISQQP